MRVPLNPAGSREMLIITLLTGLPAVAAAWAAVAGGYAWCWAIAGVLALLWMAGLAFFRDPERSTPMADGLLVAPADGKVVETVRLPHDDLVGGPATRLSIFLSVLDVHVNRSPCSGVVRSVQYRPGQFLDARDPQSGQRNEANTIVIDPDEPADGPIVVRQIAGLIARRIVCSVRVGDRVCRGQRIGLIKFGSRTELIISGHDAYEPAVQVGDRVCGAVTVMARRAARSGVGTGGTSPGLSRRGDDAPEAQA